MSRALLAVCLSVFAAAAFATPSIDQCTKGVAAASSKPSTGAAAMPASAANLASVATPDSDGNRRLGSSAATVKHAAQPRIISPRWQSFLPGMFR